MASSLPTLCAGQACRDRARCARFKLRAAIARYAPYDIEHAMLDEKRPCPAFEEYRPVTFHRSKVH